MDLFFWSLELELILEYEFKNLKLFPFYFIPGSAGRELGHSRTVQFCAKRICKKQIQSSAQS